MRRLASLCLLAAAACADPSSRATAPEEFTVSLRTTGGTAHAHLTGDAERPDPRETPAQGQAVFRVTEDGIEYVLNVANIENVNQAHIHLGGPDAAGPVVVWLTDGPPAVPFPLNLGRYDGRLASGTITADDLNFSATAPLRGQPLSALIAHMKAGNTYVNVHTNDGVAPANTGPGDFPGGEVRGQITSGSLFQR